MSTAKFSFLDRNSSFRLVFLMLFTTIIDLLLEIAVFIALVHMFRGSNEGFVQLQRLFSRF